MDLSLEATPGAHRNSTQYTADGTRGLDEPQTDTIISCPQQNHRRKDGKRDPRAQIAKEKHKLQPQKAGTRENITETKNGFFQNITLPLRAFFGSSNRRVHCRSHFGSRV